MGEGQWWRDDAVTDQGKRVARVRREMDERMETRGGGDWERAALGLGDGRGGGWGASWVNCGAGELRGVGGGSSDTPGSATESGRCHREIAGEGPGESGDSQGSRGLLSSGRDGARILRLSPRTSAQI